MLIVQDRIKPSLLVYSQDIVLHRLEDIGVVLSKSFDIFEEQLIWAYFIQKTQKAELIGYVDAGYLSDPHKAQSQRLYVCI